MNLIAAHLFAEEIWSASGGNATSEEIAAKLLEAGYAAVPAATVRSWKRRYSWSLPKALAINTTELEHVVSLETAVSNMIAGGSAGAESVLRFLGFYTPTTMAEAEAASKIAIELSMTALRIGDGLMTRRTIDAQRGNGSDALTIEGRVTSDDQQARLARAARAIEFERRAVA